MFNRRGKSPWGTGWPFGSRVALTVLVLLVPAAPAAMATWGEFSQADDGLTQSTPAHVTAVPGEPALEGRGR